LGEGHGCPESNGNKEMHPMKPPFGFAQSLEKDIKNQGIRFKVQGVR